MSDQQETQAVEMDVKRSSPSAARYLKQAATAAAEYLHQASARVVEYRGRRRPVKAVDFGLGELVKPLTSLRISMLGEYLCLPGAVAAVITKPSGRQIVHRVGGLLNYPPGHYGLQLVDMRQQRLHLQSVRATADDGLQVTLTVDIIWQVDNVIPVVNMDQPHATWRSACKAAVLKVIQMNSHDSLVPVQGSTPISEEEIEKAIWDEISATPGLSAFKIIEVKVLHRQGDPERLEKLREASVGTTQREQELMAQIEELKERLQGQQPQPAAQPGPEEPVDEILMQARRLAQDLKQYSQAQPLNRDQLLQWLEVSGLALSRLATLQNLASAGDAELFEFMAHAFNAAVYSFSPNGAGTAAGEAAAAVSREPEPGSGVQPE